jgi:hypothetical protein
MNTGRRDATSTKSAIHAGSSDDRFPPPSQNITLKQADGEPADDCQTHEEWIE